MTQLRWPSCSHDNSIDIVGERLGLLRGAAAEVNLRTVDSSFGDRYRCRNLIKRIATRGTSGGVLAPLLEIKDLHTEFRTGAGVVRAVDSAPDPRSARADHGRRGPLRRARSHAAAGRADA